MAAASSAAMFHFRFTGISRSRTSSVVAFREMARLGDGVTLPSSSIPETSPTVETVIRRGDSAAPQGCWRMVSARVRFSRLFSGSPIPMNTMLVGRFPATSMAQ